MFAVFIFLPVGKSNPQVLSGILQQFANAALKQSKAVKGPGPLRLPILAAATKFKLKIINKCSIYLIIA